MTHFQSSNLNGGVFAFVDIRRLPHIDVVQNDFVVPLLIFDDPLFVVLEFDDGRFGRARRRPGLLPRLVR